MNYVKNLKFFGIDAKEIPCLTGAGAPTLETEGAVGMFYMDEGTGAVYKRTANGWEPLTEEDVMALSGGTFSGPVNSEGAGDLETPQFRNIAVVDEEPEDLSDYADGDIILVTE